MLRLGERLGVGTGVPRVKILARTQRKERNIWLPLMAAEVYRTATILSGMASLPRASVFLRDKLFSKVVTAPTDQVDISFYNGKAKLAPYCSRFAVGAATRKRQQLRLFSPPFMKPVRTLTRMICSIAA